MDGWMDGGKEGRKNNLLIPKVKGFSNSIPIHSGEKNKNTKQDKRQEKKNQG